MKKLDLTFGVPIPIINKLNEMINMLNNHEKRVGNGKPFQDEYEMYNFFLNSHSNHIVTYFPTPEGWKKWRVLSASQEKITLEKLLV